MNHFGGEVGPVDRYTCLSSYDCAAYRSPGTEAGLRALGPGSRPDEEPPRLAEVVAVADKPARSGSTRGPAHLASWDPRHFAGRSLRRRRGFSPAGFGRPG